MSRHAAGFTLIELAVTTAIIALLASIATPPMSALLEQQRAASATSSLIAHMQLARMAAITHNRRTVLCPSEDGRNCAAGNDWSGGWLLFVDGDGNRMPDTDADILRSDLPTNDPHLRIHSTAGREQLRYLPDGSSAGSNLSIAICNPRGELLGKVIVNNAGRPRSELPSHPTACPA